MRKKKTKEVSVMDDVIGNFAGRPVRVIIVAITMIAIIFPLYWLVTSSFKVKADYLADVSGDSTQDTSQSTNSSANLSQGQEITLANTVNVRESMSETASKVAVAYAGEQVTVIESYADGWTKVNYNGKQGYCKTEYLQ